MKYNQINEKKGIAGLNVFLSIIAILFMIGLLVMLFVISGSKLQTTTKVTDTASATQNSINITLSPVTLTACSNARDGVVTSLSAVNASGGGTIGAGNYTISGCTISNATSTFNNDLWNVTYNYRYTSNPEAQDAINETKTSLGTTTGWFGLFIVLGAMVVLVLLIVIIIRSLGNSGLMGSRERGGKGPSA